MEKTTILARTGATFSKFPRVLLLPIGAVLTALCLVFPQVGFLEWVAMIPVLYYLLSETERGRLTLCRAYLLGFFYFYCFYLVIWHWFVSLYPMEFAGISKWAAVGLIAICWFGLSLVQTVFSALIFPVFVLLAKAPLLRRAPLLLPFLLASVYTVSEWSQTLTWAGVPWARLALGQVNCGVLFHSASLFGSYFITFAIVAVNGLAAYAILHLDKVKLISILCAAVFGANLISGLVGYLTLRQDTGEGVAVAAVQGNVGSADKWQLDTVTETMKIYREYTKQAAEAGAAVVVFPETFLPYSISKDSSLGKYVSELAKEYDVTIRCGAFYHSPDGGYYNGLFTAYPDGTYAETVYAKRRLVPFGEFVPMRPVVEALVPVLADMGMLDSDLDQGNDSAIVDTVIGPAGSLICFDSIYEGLTLDAVRDGAAYICLSTNDSWFGTSAGIRMHLRQAQLRAVESGRYIIRSAATGVSAIVTPTGECLEVQDADTAGVAVADIYSRTDRTLYSYIGNTLVYLLITAELALGVVLLIDRIRRRRMTSITALEAENAPAEENAENTQE